MSRSTTPSQPPLEQEKEEVLVRDAGWAMMVQLNPEEFTSEECKEAKTLLSSQDVDQDWSRVEQSVRRLRQLHKESSFTLTDNAGLSDDQRAELVSFASKIAAENRLGQARYSGQKQVSFASWLFSPTLAWVAVLGMACVGLWSYQTDMSQLDPSSQSLDESLDRVLTGTEAQKEVTSSSKMSAQEQRGEEPLEPDPTASLVPSVSQEGPSDQVGEQEESQSTTVPVSKPVYVQPSSTDQSKTAPKKRRSRKSRAKKKSKIRSDKKRTQRRPERQVKKKRKLQQAEKKPVSVSAFPVEGTSSGLSASRLPSSRSVTARGQGKAAEMYDDDVVSSESSTAPSQELLRRPASPPPSSVRTGRKVDADPLPQAQQEVNRMVREWGEGKQEQALQRLLRWLEDYPGNEQRERMIRLGIGWARDLGNETALRRLRTYEGKSPRRKQSRKVYQLEEAAQDQDAAAGY